MRGLERYVHRSMIWFLHIAQLSTTISHAHSATAFHYKLFEWEKTLSRQAKQAMEGWGEKNLLSWLQTSSSHPHLHLHGHLIWNFCRSWELWMVLGSRARRRACQCRPSLINLDSYPTMSGKAGRSWGWNRKWKHNNTEYSVWFEIVKGIYGSIFWT